jgi:hypothetical protein
VTKLLQDSVEIDHSSVVSLTDTGSLKLIDKTTPRVKE